MKNNQFNFSYAVVATVKTHQMIYVDFKRV